MSAARRLRGALAAAITPFTDAGELDTSAIAPLVDFYARSGLDGLLVLGTTGEGVLLSADERRRAAAEFIGSAGDRLAVAVHCGAQSTRDTAALCAHAAGAGATAVAVIPPPYYALDDESLLRHLVAAAGACAPVPFYVYEFAARSGYAVPVRVLQRLRDAAANLTGLKVSDAPFELVEPYLTEGLDVFIGAEGLIHRGLERGAAGAVSGLAAALPELTVDAVRSRSAEASVRAARARAEIQRFPFQSALKALLGMRGVPVGGAVRGPLRALEPEERDALAAAARDPSGDIAPLLGG